MRRGPFALRRRASRRSDLAIHLTTVPQTAVGLLGALVERRSAEGEEVHVACGTSSAYSVEEATDVLGVPFHDIGLRRAISPLSDVRSLVRAVRLFRRLRPFQIVAHTPKAGLIGCLAARATGVPCIVYVVHGAPLQTARRAAFGVLWVAEAIAYLCAHSLLAVSPSLRAYLRAIRLPRSARIDVLGRGSVQGIDTRHRFNPEKVLGTIPPEAQQFVQDHRPLVVFVGRMVRDKGISDVREVWEATRAAFPTAGLWVVGSHDEPRDQDAPSVDWLRQRADVFLTGRVPEPEQYLVHADVLLFPSYREGLGNVVLEAGSMSLAVVGYDVTGVRDACRNGITGLLVPPGDIAALISALHRVLEDPSFAARLGAAGRRYVGSTFEREDLIPRMQTYLRANQGRAPDHQGPRKPPPHRRAL